MTNLCRRTPGGTNQYPAMPGNTGSYIYCPISYCRLDAAIAQQGDVKTLPTRHPQAHCQQIWQMISAAMQAC
jgi:hypothetical protein